MHSWQVVALPLKSQLSGSFSMVLGDIIHVLGRPRCGLCCVRKNAQFLHSLLQVSTLYMVYFQQFKLQFKEKKILFEAKFSKVRVVQSYGLGTPHLWNCSQYSVSTIHACLNVEPPIHRAASKVYFLPK